MVEMTLAALAETVGGSLNGDGERVVRGAASLAAAGPEEVTFLANARYEKQVASTRAGAVIISASFSGQAPEGVALIRCDDPYFAYREAMVAFYGFSRPHFDGVDARACVDPSAELGDGVRIAPFATVAPGAKIGDNTVLYPGVHVGVDCRIGAECLIYPNTVLYHGTILGDRVTVHANCSIGQDGFGYATHNGRHEKIPQAGWVELENDVEIGACCAIDRATMGATVVGEGTKFSDHVTVGHGTKLGKHCLIVAKVGLAGSVTVGNYCVLAGQVGVAGHLKIGDGTRVGAQAAVIGDLAPGSVVGGTPAIPLGRNRRVWATLPRLPQMRTTLRRVAREVGELKRRLDLRDDGDGGDEEGA